MHAGMKGGGTRAPAIPSALIYYCSGVNNRKFSSLKQQPFMILRLCGSEVRQRSNWAKIKVLAGLCSSLEASSSSGLNKVVGRVRFHGTVELKSSFLAGCQQRSLQLLSRGLHICQLMTPFIFKESDGGLNPSYALCLLPHLSLILLSSSSSLTAYGIRLGAPNLGNPGSPPYFKVHNINPSHKAPFAM